MASSIFNPSAGEQNARATTNATWSPNVSRAASSGANFSSGLAVESYTGYNNYRVFEPFDTSSLPDNAVVSAATLELYRDDSLEPGGNGFVNANSTSLEIVASTQASGTSYTSTDYAAVTFSSKGSINLASTSNGAYFSISLTDLSLINVSGFTKLALITGRDLSDSAPTGDNRITWQTKSDANPPKLTVTYTVPTSGGSFLLNFI